MKHDTRVSLVRLLPQGVKLTDSYKSLNCFCLCENLASSCVHLQRRPRCERTTPHSAVVPQLQRTRSQRRPSQNQTGMSERYVRVSRLHLLSHDTLLVNWGWRGWRCGGFLHQYLSGTFPPASPIPHTHAHTLSVFWLSDRLKTTHQCSG